MEQKYYYKFKKPDSRFPEYFIKMQKLDNAFFEEVSEEEFMNWWKANYLDNKDLAK